MTMNHQQHRLRFASIPGFVSIAVVFVAYLYLQFRSKEEESVTVSKSALDVVSDAENQKLDLSKKKEALLTQEQLDLFERDGYIVLSGLFDSDKNNDVEGNSSSDTKVLERLMAAGDRIIDKEKDAQSGGGYFKVMEVGVMFDDKGTSSSSSVAGAREMGGSNVFREVALFSKLPQIAAELMRLNPATQNLRILRDVFLGRGVDAGFCSWHVDDSSFWPEAPNSTASEQTGLDQHGINAWIALDDMPIEFGGSMALSPGSHKAPWRYEAYDVINMDFSRNGIEKDEVFDIIKSGKFNTCNMETTAPDTYGKIEETKKVFDLKRGDVIFHTRWLFHRTISFTPEGKQFYKQQGKDFLKRYSIRYVPGTAKLPTGFSLELSIMSNNENAGKTLDGVDHEDGSWYPKCWPAVDADIDSKLDEIVSSKMPIARSNVNAAREEMFAFLKNIKNMGSSNEVDNDQKEAPDEIDANGEDSPSEAQEESSREVGHDGQASTSKEVDTDIQHSASKAEKDDSSSEIERNAQESPNEEEKDEQASTSQEEKVDE